VSGTAIGAGMMAVCVLLVIVHKRHRIRRHKEIAEYCKEQTAYRNAISALLAAATTDALASSRDNSPYADDDDDHRPLLEQGSSWKFRDD